MLGLSQVDNKKTGRYFCVGFSPWKADNLRPLLESYGHPLHWLKSWQHLYRVKPNSFDKLLFWGGLPPKGLIDLARDSGANLVRIEDGFVRSVGLGSDFIPPHSLVLDEIGIYFDPSQPSALEMILNGSDFTTDELEDARQAREFIVRNSLTKYNLCALRKPTWKNDGRRVILVAGQVEDDASISLGAGNVRTNIGLLEAVRDSCPNDFIVFKPHPDVMSRNRRGRVTKKDVNGFVDWVESQCSVVSCLDACDEVHTMTSLSGFDALLRNKKVVVYGQPFYAGWGLTHDVIQKEESVAFQRRSRALSLDELVAGAMIRYPTYWDPRLKCRTSCMNTLQGLLSERQQLESNGGLERLRNGWLRRQRRKLYTSLKARIMGYK